MSQTKPSNQSPNQPPNQHKDHSMCFYTNMKESEINNINTKIKYGEELIRKIEYTIKIQEVHERTLKEFKGMIYIKNVEIECNKNLIKQIEEMPDCI